jgi:hypothetical protein
VTRLTEEPAAADGRIVQPMVRRSWRRDAIDKEDGTGGDRAQFALQRARKVREGPVEPDREPVVSSRSVPDGIDLSAAQTERLFHEHGLARSECCLSDLGMTVVTGTDEHKIHVVALEDAAPISCGVGAARAPSRIAC